MFCYVGNVFSPGLDEGVGDLWRVSSAFQLSLGRGEGEMGVEEGMKADVM